MLALAFAFVATAQVGGPTRTKRDTAGAKIAASSTKPSDVVSQRFEKEGVAVDYSIKATPGDDGKSRGLTGGADAVVSFRLTDARTGQPLSGLHPNAWVSSRAADRIPNETECKDKIRTFMGGLLSARAKATSCRNREH